MTGFEVLSGAGAVGRVIFARRGRGRMKHRQFDIADREVRRELPERDRTYWLTFARRRSIGFAKQRVWTWQARLTWPDGATRKTTVGVTADSPCGRSNLERLTFDEAMGRVRQWCAAAHAAGLDGIRRAARAPEPREDGAYTVRDAFWDWLEWRREAGLPGGQYTSTYRRYLATGLGSLPLAQLEQRDIEKWRDAIAAMPAWDATTRFRPIGEVELDSATFEAMRRRRGTANNHLMALKCALDHAHLHGLVDSSIGWRGVRHLEKVGRYRPLVLESGEVEGLIGRLDPPVRDLAEAVWHTGARIGELLGLTPERVLAGHGKIVVVDTKKRTARGIALTRRGTEFFARHAQGRGHGEAVFVDPDGKPWTVPAAGRRLRRELCRLRYPEPVTYRALRSSYSSFLIARGVPPAVVARQLGHTSSATTERHYGHISESVIDTMVREKIDRADLVPGS